MKLLIGTDLSQGSAAAIHQGLSAAAHFRQAGRQVDVVVGYVEGQEGWYPKLKAASVLDEDNRVRLQAQVRDFVDDVVQTSPDNGLNSPADTDLRVVVAEGRSDKGLTTIADDIGADWLFVGKSGQGALARLVAGSTVDRLTHRPPCKLVICHETHPDWRGGSNIMVGADFSEHSLRAVELGIDLAAVTDAKLHLVHVVYPPGPVAMSDGLIGWEPAKTYPDAQRAREQADEQMDALVAQHADQLDTVQWTAQTLLGYPSHTLVEYVDDHDIDALVLGTVGRSAVDEFLLGSVANGVVKHMTCSVYLTPPAQ